MHSPPPDTCLVAHLPLPHPPLAPPAAAIPRRIGTCSAVTTSSAAVVVSLRVAACFALASVSSPLLLLILLSLAAFVFLQRRQHAADTRHAHHTARQHTPHTHTHPCCNTQCPHQSRTFSRSRFSCSRVLISLAFETSRSKSFLSTVTCGVVWLSVVGRRPRSHYEAHCQCTLSPCTPPRAAASTDARTMHL